MESGVKSRVRVSLPRVRAGYGQITDMYRYRQIYRLSADISVLQIREMLIGIGYPYWPIGKPISVAHRYKDIIWPLAKHEYIQNPFLPKYHPFGEDMKIWWKRFCEWVCYFAQSVQRRQTWYSKVDEYKVNQWYFNTVTQKVEITIL